MNNQKTLELKYGDRTISRRVFMKHAGNVVVTIGIGSCATGVSSTLPFGTLDADERGTVNRLAGNIFVIVSPGFTNVTVLATDDGLLVVDSGWPSKAFSEKIKINLKKISPLPVRYLVNTHYHVDHTGGNAIVGKGATIIAHKNCREVLRNDPNYKTLAPHIGIEKGKILQLGDQTVELFHPGMTAHTQGDVVVVFPKEKILVAGDLFYNGIQPYLDTDHGFDTANWIGTIQTLAERYPDYTIVPGHLGVSDIEGFIKFGEYLTQLRAVSAKAIKAGQTPEQMVSSIAPGAFPARLEIPKLGMTLKSNAVKVYNEMKSKEGKPNERSRNS